MTQFNKNRAVTRGGRTDLTKFKNDQATVRDMTRTPSRASARLTLLLKQMEEKRKGTRGIRAAIARQTKLDPAVVSDFLNGNRDNVKGETIDRVADALRLDDRFFSDPWPDGVVKHYTDYLKRKGGKVAAVAPAPNKAEPATKAGADDDDDLRDLSPTKAELAAWDRHLLRHRYAKVTTDLKRSFILGRRDGRVQDAIDGAVNRMGDEFARRADSDEPKGD